MPRSTCQFKKNTPIIDDGMHGYKIFGGTPTSLAGSTVTIADFNNDKRFDILFGGPFFGKEPDTTTAYLMFGKIGLGDDGPINLGLLNKTTGVVIKGFQEDQLSTLPLISTWAADINGDGIPDILMGIPAHSSGFIYNGVSVIIFGNETIGVNGTLSLTSLNIKSGVRLLAMSQYEYSGAAVVAADVNFDGIDDMIIGAPGSAVSTLPVPSTPGKVYVIRGTTQFNTESIWLSPFSSDKGFSITGATPGDGAGYALAAGKINNDTIPDIILSAPWAANYPTSNTTVASGTIYVIYGHSNIGQEGPLALKELKPSDGFRIEGEKANMLCGKELQAGDVNGDGYTDIVFSAPGDNSIYTFFGRPTSLVNIFNTRELTGKNGFKISIPKDLGRCRPLKVADLRNHGYDDIIIGCPNAIMEQSDQTVAGAIFTLYGSPSIGESGLIDLKMINETTGFILTNSLSDETPIGKALDIKDVDFDGCPDLVLGSPVTFFNQSKQSRGHVVYGGDHHNAGRELTDLQDSIPFHSRFLVLPAIGASIAILILLFTIFFTSRRHQNESTPNERTHLLRRSSHET